MGLLIVFRYVCRRLDVDGTTRSLCVAPSTIDRSLRHLHTRFGSPLFVHSKGNVTPAAAKLGLRRRLRGGLENLRRAVGVIGGSRLGGGFVVCNPRLVSYSGGDVLVHYLQRSTSIRVRYRSVLVSTRGTRRLLIRHGTSLIVARVPIVDHSIVYVPLRAVHGALVYDGERPQVASGDACRRVVTRRFARLVSGSTKISSVRVRVSREFVGHGVSFHNSSLLAVVGDVTIASLLKVIPCRLCGSCHSFLGLGRVGLRRPLPSVGLCVSCGGSSLGGLIFSQFVSHLGRDF